MSDEAILANAEATVRVVLQDCGVDFPTAKAVLARVASDPEFRIALQTVAELKPNSL